MSNRERTGKRTLEYSAWHRPESLARFVDRRDSYACKMIDVDGLEYDPKTLSPLVAVETAMGTHQRNKTWAVTRRLAEQFGGAALCVLYDLSEKRNPRSDHGELDISKFLVRCSIDGKVSDWQELSPGEYAEKLVLLRETVRKRMTPIER